MKRCCHLMEANTMTWHDAAVVANFDVSCADDGNHVASPLMRAAVYAAGGDADDDGDDACDADVQHNDRLANGFCHTLHPRRGQLL